MVQGLHIVGMFSGTVVHRSGRINTATVNRFDAPDLRQGDRVEAFGWMVIFILAAVALWGLGSLQASLMASARTERAQAVQEEQAMNDALDAAIAYTPEPVILSLESLAEQVGQMELRLRALELERGIG